MKFFEKIVKILTLVSSYFSQAALVLAMVIIVANIIRRIAWSPVPGTVEIVEMSGAVILSMSIAYTAYKKGHIMVSVLTDRFSKRVQGIIETITSAVSIFFIFLLARQTFIFAERMSNRGLITAHLKIPIAPSIYLVGAGLAILMTVLVFDMINALISAIKGGTDK